MVIYIKPAALLFTRPTALQGLQPGADADCSRGLRRRSLNIVTIILGVWQEMGQQ